MKEDHYHRRIESLDHLPCQLRKHQKLQKKQEIMLATMHSFMGDRGGEKITDYHTMPIKTQHINVSHHKMDDLLDESNLKQQLA